MAKLRFNLKPGNGNLQIRAIFQNGKEQHYLNTGYTIPDDKLKGKYRHWDYTRQRVRATVPSVDLINGLLVEWEMKWTEYMDRCKRDRAVIDIAYMKRMLSGAPEVAGVERLIALVDKWLAHIRATHGAKTVLIYERVRNDIARYEEHTGKSVLVSDVGKTFWAKWGGYLMNEEDNANSTVNRKIKNVLAVLHYAESALGIDLPKGYDQVVKYKQVQASKFPLEDGELAVLKDYKAPTKWAQGVLDAFLLSAETGLRVSDIMQLKKVHIKEHVLETGQVISYIELTQQKVSNVATMPLSNVAKEILDRYADVGRDVPIFDINYGQSANRMLKEMLEDVKINRMVEVVRAKGAVVERELVPICEVVSFHMARNTYITRLLRTGISPAYVRDNAGHSNLKVTMQYYRNEDVARWEETLRVMNKK